VHLYHWLETNDYGRFLADQDLLNLEPTIEQHDDNGADRILA
jgi:hypothetical protein